MSKLSCSYLDHVKVTLTYSSPKAPLSKCQLWARRDLGVMSPQSPRRTVGPALSA